MPQGVVAAPQGVAAPQEATMLPARLAEVLDRPPAGFSPAAIWWWSGEPLDRARLRWQLERFVAGGVRNLIILNLAPSGPMFGSDADEPAFFSEPWWELLDGVCADAKELGAFLWFYDQLGFSGADLQARLVQETPSYAGRWLERRDGDVTVVTRGFDYLSPDACATLIDRVHGEFERRLPHWLGTVLVGSFQDELPALPTWSPGFAEEFERRRGYDLTPHLRLLWADEEGPLSWTEEGGPDGSLPWAEDGGLDGPLPSAGEGGPDGSRVRRDYHRTRAELAEEAFFRPLAAWHDRHGLLHGCDQQDPARAGHPVDGVRLYADYARTHRWFGAPGSDHHGDARIHSSLAHLYGRPRTWIEAFHSSGWGGTLEETFDWLLPWLRSGATLYNPHAVYYTTKGGWWEWAPPSTDWRQPYWRHHGVFADAVTRLCAALSLGRHVCDVAVLLPTATAQAGTRLDGVDEDAERAQRIYRELVGDMAWFRTIPGVLDRLNLDADVIDDDSVARATVTEGRLRVADEAYATVILPGCTVLEEATERRLAEFAAAGGRVIAVGTDPGGPPRLRAPGPGLGSDCDEPHHRRAAGAPEQEDDAVPDADRLGGSYEFVGSPSELTGPSRVDPPGRGLGAVPDADRLGGSYEFVGSPSELTTALTGLPRVDAPMPALVREVDGATLVFLTAAFPRASEVSVGRPDERGIELGWLDALCDFDPGRYAADMRVRVRDVAGGPLLVSPFGGPPRPLPYERDGDVTEVVVPFDDGPAALLVFPGTSDADGLSGGGEPAADTLLGAGTGGSSRAGKPDAEFSAADGLPGEDPHRGGSSDAGAPAPYGPPGEDRPGTGAEGSDTGVEGPNADSSAGWTPEGTSIELGPAWEMELVPTLDDTWGDFARPGGSRSPVERWEFRHRVETDGDDGLNGGWATPGHGDAAWEAAYATFGPHVLATGPARPDALPGPSPEEGVDWRPVTYSSSRGIHKDPIHRETLGPKGHVPEEFMDLGDVPAGQAVHVRTELTVPETVTVTLAVGAAAAKTAWLDGTRVALDDGGHLAMAPVRLEAGTHVLDLRLTPDEDVRLRAHVAFVRDASRYRRPEWIAAAGPARPGARVALTTTVHLDAVPERAVLQVAAVEPCRVLVNGAEAGRQGGFDPYAEHDAPRVRRYDIAEALRAGANDLTLELTERDAPAAVLADGDVAVTAASGWRATRDGEPVPVTVHRRPYGDPAALHLRRRPHPLPGAAWLEDAPADGCVLPVALAVPRGGAERIEWFRFGIPPGATRMDLLIHGEPQVFVDGVGVPFAGESPAADGERPARVSVELSPGGGVRAGAVRIRTRPGYEGGAAFAGPIRFEVGTGRIEQGDWETAGLAEYSGGVRYRTRVDLTAGGRTVLDLGRVRGTAEVFANGRSTGVRVCSPYRFDLTDAVREGANDLEILVFGTLAPYLDAVSPTHFVFPGQRASGLFGPVRILRAPGG
ncbi:hypothetical protein GCM10029978_081560 [Actinoallomurus acanthiterrae]